MKNLALKTITFLSLSFIGINSNGQVTKSKLLLSTSVYYYNNKSTKTYSNETNFNNELNYSLTLQKAISNKLLLGLGVGQIYRKREDIYGADAYYKSKDIFWDFNLITEYQQRIEKKLLYSPVLLFNYSPGRQVFKRKDPGFQETGSVSKGKMWGISIEPLNLSYFLKEKYRLSVSLGKIIYGEGKNESNITGIDPNGKGKTFYINFSPYLSNIKISVIL